jgi:Mrp family chromosome partitioning ATPase
MAHDDKSSHQQLQPIDSGSKVLSLSTARLPYSEEHEAKEEIRRMTEVSRLSYSEMENLGMIHPGMRQVETLNAFRELRTKVYQAAAGRGNVVVLVTSLCPGGGSSFVSLNLGAAIALDESRTSILVDCNVYDPSLHRLLPVEPDFGLADYLEDISLDVKDVIYATGVRRLRLIPAGSRRAQGTEYFTSGRMRRFVQELRTRYRDRHIIIDAASVSTNADARILSELCDFVLLVVPNGRLTSSQIAAGVETIAPEKLLGVVFNNG